MILYVIYEEVLSHTSLSALSISSAEALAYIVLSLLPQCLFKVLHTLSTKVRLLLRKNMAETLTRIQRRRVRRKEVQYKPVVSTKATDQVTVIGEYGS